MPKYNELKHFNAAKIVNAYQNTNADERRQAQIAENAGPLNLTWTFDGSMTSTRKWE